MGYVFSRSSDSSTSDSMYIAEKENFTANKLPYQDLDSGSWVEFKAPRGAAGRDGKDGKKGDKGDTGLKGEKGDVGTTGATGVKGKDGQKGDKGATGERGNDGMGLKYAPFKLKGVYTRGDYVFSRSSDSSTSDSMYIAEK